MGGQGGSGRAYRGDRVTCHNLSDSNSATMAVRQAAVVGDVKWVESSAAPDPYRSWRG